MTTPADILDFWFAEITPAQWWNKSDDFDRLIATRFGAVLEAAARCELYAWRATPAGRLAEVIVLDQFSRNIHRGTPAAFAQDAQALALAEQAVAAGDAAPDAALSATERSFLLMPFMHSESAAVHARAEVLFEALGLPDTLDFERRHRAIVERFGRYPHRNAILGRASTDEEQAFLREPGSSF